MVGSVLDARSGRAESEMWCSCWTRAGAVEASVREEDLRAARAVDALRRIALDGAIVDVCIIRCFDRRFGGRRQAWCLVMDSCAEPLVSCERTSINPAFLPLTRHTR